jgi:iron complex transport system ATP-binding protein
VIEGRLIISSVSLDIKPGENWVVIGPNGSGKTTLLKAICGYQGISRGTVEVLGQRFGETDLRDLRTQIGMISSYLSDLILLDDNVLDLVVSGEFGQTRLWGVPPYEAVRKGRSLLRLLGCARYEDRILRELSQGERQRVLIARAMMANSQLLVLDEPCAGLDLKAREYLLSGLSRIGRNHSKTMIYTTHSIDEIPGCFTHALLLRQGHVVAKGRIADTLTSLNMSRCFGVGLEIRRWRGRYYSLVK